MARKSATTPAMATVRGMLGEMIDEPAPADRIFIQELDARWIEPDGLGVDLACPLEGRCA